MYYYYDLPLILGTPCNYFHVTACLKPPLSLVTQLYSELIFTVMPTLSGQIEINPPLNEYTELARSIRSSNDNDHVSEVNEALVSLISFVLLS